MTDLHFQPLRQQLPLYPYAFHTRGRYDNLQREYEGAVTVTSQPHPCQEADGPSLTEPAGSLQRTPQPAYILPQCLTSFKNP